MSFRVGLLVLFLVAGSLARASSHREAPFLAEHPRVDGTDFFLFMSYESGRQDYVTLLANYGPYQAPFAGPSYHPMDPDALYEIHVDSDGDAQEDLTFQFRFQVSRQDLPVTVGGQTVSAPLYALGPVGPGAADVADLNVRETYTLSMVTGDRRLGVVQGITEDGTGVTTFRKAADNLGSKTFADYASYAAAHVYTISIPGCSNPGKLFVGPRTDPFAARTGQIHDLFNVASPTGEGNAATQASDLDGQNVVTLALEVHKECLRGTDPVIGAWTTASLRQARVVNPNPVQGGKGATVEGGAWTQVSRVGMPLVNTLMIGLPDKDLYNASEPRDDSQFQLYFTHPSFPTLLDGFVPSLPAPAAVPRDDLVDVMMRGVESINRPGGSPETAEILRLDTETTPRTAGSQSALGLLGNDPAGFPNGRRPGDDVVDVTLRYLYGAAASTPVTVELVDGVRVGASSFGATFPYLNTPAAGSP